MPTYIQQPLIPKNKARHLKKTGRTSDFRDKFWQKFDGVHQYERRINRLKEDLNIVEDFGQNQQIYLEANIDFESVNETKGSTPEQIWSLSGIDVVASSSDGQVIVSGKKEDFRRLKGIVNQANFATAKSGSPRTTIREKNAFREIFSISSLGDHNTKIEGRVDSNIEQAIALNEVEAMSCVIEFRSDVPRWSYEEKFSTLREIIQTELVPASEDIVIHNMFCFASLTVEKILAILRNTNYSFVQFIRIKDELAVQRLIPELDLSAVEIGAPETDEVIGVIDSGVGAKVLERLKFDEFKLIPANKSGYKTHGTFVTSRVLFGNNVFAQFQTKTVSPLCKYLDIQVLYDSDDDTTECDESILMKAIEEAFRRYDNVTLYNLSINIKKGILKSEFNKKVHTLTEFIDSKARDHDKLPIISVGNQEWFQSFDYAELFKQENHDLFISVPSDSLNSVSVGSITNCGSNLFHCEFENFPSPFTRKGAIRNNWKKPELAHYGGNILLPNHLSYSNDSYLVAARNKGGVEGLLPSSLGKDYGTSQSTPLVSREGIKALSAINQYEETNLLELNGNRANLVKASLIHSTAFNSQQTYSENDHKHCVGYGVPNVEPVFNDSVDKATIIYADKIDYGEKKHIIVFELPEMLVDTECRFSFTMVYNPPVNKNFPKQYNQLYLTATPTFLHPYINEEGKSKVKSKYIKKGKWNWDNYSSHDFSSIHFSSEKKVSSIYLGVTVQLFARLHYETEMINHLDEIEQNYAFILTIEDLEERGELKEQLVVSNQFNQIDIEEEIEYS